LCGHDIQPIAFHRHQGQYQALKDCTLFLSEHSKLCAFKGLAYLDLGMLKAIKFSFLQQGLPFNSLIANALKLVYLAKKNNCTHFHAHFAQAAAATAIVAARLCGATVSFVGHGYDIYATPQDLELKLNTVDFAIAVCQDMVNDFKQLAPNVAVSLVYCGVELDRLSNNHSPMTEHVNFLGAKQSTWFISNSHHYDAMIVPFELASNGDRDTGPVVVKEAMALKLPVITTYFMGCKEFITHSTGLHVPPKSPSKLAKAITLFYAMSFLEVQSLKDNAYHRVCALYSAKKQAGKLSSVIEQHG
jgi:colanic acid/amylovoran biosynthesis glycosyltransferase